jgi:hypothetical protein
MGAEELAAVIRRRFPAVEAGLEVDLRACEETEWGEAVSPREALRLIQTLHRHEEKIRAAAKPGALTELPENSSFKQQERAS